MFVVSNEVRKVEAEIDHYIQNLEIWRVPRSALLDQLMVIWRDGLELAGLKTVHALTFGVENALESSIAMEHQITSGVYQALKWSMLYARDEANGEVPLRELTELVMRTAPYYQILVDALKLGAHDKVEFAVDHESKTLTVYEGGNVSGHDEEILVRGHVTTPLTNQSPLIEDSDQLTTDWNAGQFREYWRWLRRMAEEAETETIMAQAGPLAPMRDVMKRPVIVELPQPPGHLASVQRDLTLTINKVQSQLNWKIDSWHDCPLVQIGDRIVGVSLALRTLSENDDYMLRAAVLNDPAQYERVSGLREERMIGRCKEVFERKGWTFTPHYLLTAPAREIDGYATKHMCQLVVQLKSTLRPQSPWEVLKRNADVIEGIRHTEEVLERLGPTCLDIVITDGYRGDYATWQASLRTGIAVGTLSDLDLIADDPHGAFDVLAERAGITGEPAVAGLEERRLDLCGWHLRMVDEQANKDMKG